MHGILTKKSHRSLTSWFLTELKYDLVERGTALEYFHASENAQAVRNRVFEIIERNLSAVRIDSIIVEKHKISCTDCGPQ